MEKIKLDSIVVVEGKYDKIKLDSILDATVITCEGFGLFRDLEKKEMLRILARERGIVILCDSDGGGKVIRRHLNSFLPKDRVTNLFIPEIEGKEKRKKTPSKEGKLGVEGIDADVLRGIFAPLASAEGGQCGSEADVISLGDLVADGLSGGENSNEKREMLASKLGLPKKISTKMLIGAINLLGGRKTYENALQECGIKEK